MSNYEATKYDFDGANLTGIEGIPTATIVPWSSSSVPSGFLECDGSAVSRSTYSALFAIISTTYGVGDGASTFNLPNLSDNVAVGKSNNKALASSGGANTASGNTANHTLSEAELASHSHSGGATSNNLRPGANPHISPSPSATASGNTGSAGSGTGHADAVNVSILQPYLTIIYIIKT